VWALGRLIAPDALEALAVRHRTAEPDPVVREEWAVALKETA
jgi:hypothetical protein